MDREISRLTGHFIICGAGRVGRSAARELARKPLPFVVVDTSEEKLQKYASEGWLTLVGDATQAPVLQQLRIEHAQGLVAATTTDAINIYIILTARSLNPKIKIIARAVGRRCRKASADGGRRLGGLALSLRRLSHCANVYASQRGRFLRHRHEPEASAGDRGSESGARARGSPGRRWKARASGRRWA